MTQPKLFSESTFKEIRKEYSLQDYIKLQEERDHLLRVVNGHKGFVVKNRANKKDTK
jgi:hypothetical protein